MIKSGSAKVKNNEMIQDKGAIKLLNRNRVVLILLFLLTVAVIWSGMIYADNRQEEMLEEGENQAEVESEDENESDENEESGAESEDFSQYEENRENLSVIDYLNYMHLIDEETVITFYGDLSESEEWTTGIENYINEQAEISVTANRVSFPDYDSYELLEENSAGLLTESNPDVIFFQLPIYGDQMRDISLDSAAQYMENNYNAINDVLPDALIVFVTPSPRSSRMGSYNSRTLDYTSYLNQTATVAEELEVPQFDVHAAYLQALEDQGIELEDTLMEDGETLNDQGTDLYSTLFIEQLQVPVDTRGGI